jgi:hypothetical protein
MVITKLHTVLAIFIGVALVGLGAGLGAYRALASQRSTSEAGSEQALSNSIENAEAIPVRFDRIGDPLPPGALTRLGSVPFRHRGPLTSVQLTSDSRILASASRDGTLRLWEAATGKEVRRFDIFPETFSFGLSADGQTVAAPVSDRDNSTTVRIWSVATGRKTHRVEPGTVVKRHEHYADRAGIVSPRSPWVRGVGSLQG